MEKLLIIFAAVAFVFLMWNIFERNRKSFDAWRLNVIVSDFLMQKGIKGGRRTFFKILFLAIYWLLLIVGAVDGWIFWLLFALGVFIPAAVIYLSALMVLFFYLLGTTLRLIFFNSIRGFLDGVFGLFAFISRWRRK